MTLKELMKLEESLLLCKTKYEFCMPFNDYVIMHDFIDKIENITNLYFTIIMDYEKYLKSTYFSIEERKEALLKYNENILNCDVNVDLTKYKEWTEKYINDENIK